MNSDTSPSSAGLTGGARFTCQRRGCGRRAVDGGRNVPRLRRKPLPSVGFSAVGGCLWELPLTWADYRNLFSASHSCDPRINPSMLILKPLLARSLARSSGCRGVLMWDVRDICVIPLMKCCICGQDGRAAVIIKSLLWLLCVHAAGA